LKAPTPRALQVNELNLTGEDAPWKPAIDVFRSAGLADSCGTFIELLDSQVDLRPLATDLAQKADRSYVDNHLRELENSINDSIAAATQKQADDFGQQLEEEREMLSVIQQYAQQNIDSLKVGLAEYRRSMFEIPELAEAPLAFVPRPLKPLFPTRPGTPTDLRNPGLIKTPYKRRAKPFAPKPLGTVLGVSINHLSPRVRVSTMINHRNSRYSIPF
jgi:hypothetical protein